MKKVEKIPLGNGEFAELHEMTAGEIVGLIESLADKSHPLHQVKLSQLSADSVGLVWSVVGDYIKLPNGKTWRDLYPSELADIWGAAKKLYPFLPRLLNPMTKLWTAVESMTPGQLSGLLSSTKPTSVD